jgi:hypothetical protein
MEVGGGRGWETLRQLEARENAASLACSPGSWLGELVPARPTTAAVYISYLHSQPCSQSSRLLVRPQISTMYWVFSLLITCALSTANFGIPGAALAPLRLFGRQDSSCAGCQGVVYRTRSRLP